MWNTKYSMNYPAMLRWRTPTSTENSMLSRTSLKNRGGYLPSEPSMFWLIWLHKTIWWGSSLWQRKWSMAKWRKKTGLSMKLSCLLGNRFPYQTTVTRTLWTNWRSAWSRSTVKSGQMSTRSQPWNTKFSATKISCGTITRLTLS